jgi:hypothetical protein
MELVSERTKLDVALVPQTITNTNVTGLYFPVRDFHRICMHLQVGAMAATKVATLEIFQGIGRTGASGALIAGATATITANTKVTKATIACGTVLDGETIVINGLTFKGDTDTTTVAAREFSISGDNTADAVELAICINDPTYGVPGVIATADTGTVTLVATEPGETYLTIVPGAAKYTVATLEASAVVEIDNLDLTATFDHVAAKVTSTATGICSVTLLREARTQPPAQMVGASTVL